ncbi:hypothetical protein L6164_005716 [Bauhinia variegata]|uniref:Uncharacterized protein n=1 Tax=Bauhinia variegata TaxID=167791 RepID=A0ACB9PS69_BAUVA|nr:hypothetical protein L6164_005716 [Bauhinia variegata]
MCLYCDSQVALHMANNLGKCTKHIKVNYHFVWDEILKCTLQPSYVPICFQLTDLFTKALGTTQFSFLQSKLGIKHLHGPT